MNDEPEWKECADCQGNGWTWHRVNGENIRATCLSCEGEGVICNVPADGWLSLRENAELLARVVLLRRGLEEMHDPSHRGTRDAKHCDVCQLLIASEAPSVPEPNEKQ